jgi:L-lactate dehydrogenase complex protein LldG
LTGAEIVELFTKQAEAAAAEVLYAENLDQMCDMICKIAKDYQAVHRPCVTEAEKAFSPPNVHFVEDPREAELCVQEVFGAVAETGSLALASHSGKPLEAGLLADHHVAIIARNRIYKDIECLFAQIGPVFPSALVLETGPSRTADIELTLTIGVHGPERLTIIILETG